MSAFRLNLIGIMTGLKDNPYCKLLSQHENPNSW